MKSLRKEIGVWLFGVSMMIGLVAAVLAFVSARDEARRFFDQQLRIMAHNVDLNQAGPSLPELANAAHDPADDFMIQVWDETGHSVRVWPAGARLPTPDTAGFHDVVAQNVSWRTYAIFTTNRVIQVSQQFEVRDELASEAAFRSLLPTLATIPIAWLVLGYVINRLFDRLDKLATALSGQTGGSVQPLVISDVPTEVQPFVASVNLAMARMREALQVQKRFVADAAHALRTPLAVLQTQVANLRHTVSGDENVRRVEDLEKGVARAVRLVRQLLRLARSQAERGHAEPEAQRLVPIDLVAIATAAVADLLPLAEQRGLDIGLLHCHPAHILADPDDVRMLADNILENALQYTPQGGIIDVSVAVKGAEGILEVRDTGPGIPESELGRVLEPFYRASDSSVEGSGLGLSIVAAIAERCGAHLALTNRDDRCGLRVSVSFPNSTEGP